MQSSCRCRSSTGPACSEAGVAGPRSAILLLVITLPVHATLDLSTDPNPDPTPTHNTNIPIPSNHRLTQPNTCSPHPLCHSTLRPRMRPRDMHISTQPRSRSSLLVGLPPLTLALLSYHLI